ncbi:MAG: hypothetical protein LRY55_14965 [Leadbetterella sp.]|nr:hypothetical protein [Leadbetterella sp.]
MNKSPLNCLVTIALGAVLWVILAVILAPSLSESPTLAIKDPARLAQELQYIFGSGILASILSACSWYAYGAKESTAGNLGAAQKRWYMFFIGQIILSVSLITTLIMMNVIEGIEPQWFAVYYLIIALLTFIFFWLTTFLMSPRTVKNLPLGK